MEATSRVTGFTGQVFVGRRVIDVGIVSHAGEWVATARENGRVTGERRLLMVGAAREGMEAALLGAAGVTGEGAAPSADGG